MIEYEIIEHNKIKDLRIFINAISMRSLHMHHDTELLFVINGKGTINIRNKGYEVRKSDCILINAYESHEIICHEEPITFLILQFSNHFLRDYCHAIRSTVFLNRDVKSRYSFKGYETFTRQILALAQSYFGEENLYELQCVSLFSQILASLYSHMETETLNETDYSRRKKLNQRIERIANFIDSSYHDQIRLSDIAESEGITATHLSHFISENFGMTFQEYLKEKRLGCAVRLILDPSLTLSEVSANSGFSELKYMGAAFREVFGISPDEYRGKQSKRSHPNKKANTSEYIYSDKEALALLKSIV